jgi:hypothetical protein
VVDEDRIDLWLTLGFEAAWVEQGLRRLEDYLLVHAAFQAEYPDNE